MFFLISLFHHLPCASSKKELWWCEALFQCGNVTAGFPFSGGNRPKVCGHPLLELQCNNNITSLFISNQEFYVLKINQTSNTLTLARSDHLGSFCSSIFTNTTLPPEIFELSSTYKSLNVFYLCHSKLPYRSIYTCPDNAHFSVSQNLGHHNFCQRIFTVNVPKSFVPEEEVLNLTHLESALREGFEVKVKIDVNACQECSSYHILCGFDESLPLGVKCGPLHPPDLDDLYELCNQPFSCGNQRNLLYPFWISERQDCGHPDFKLECNASFAELSISSVKFRILDVNYTSRIIRLARSDYIVNLCPTNPLNAPFNQNITLYAPDTDMLTIYYDCRRDLSQSVSIYVGELVCEDDVKNYYVTRNLSWPLLRGVSGLINDFKGICERNVSIPASRPALNTLERTPTTDNLRKALEEGFELELNRDCSMCIDSGGACGYNHISRRFVCYCDGWTQNHICDHTIWGLGFLLFNFVVGFLIVRILICVINYTSNKSDDLRQHDLKALIPLKHYSYEQVKRITNSFAEVVGKGGFGTVYRGTLCDGRSVAVKILKDSKGNGEDFINEVASMSKTSHVNIVSLLGFCSEGSKGAIIYEYLENGSLDQFISSKTSMNMDWMTLYGVALGVARGVEYLHYGCKTRIVHFDIKPQNVLLDDNLCPKVSDFGLAKLCEKRESIMSLLETRGTIGYIAPEVFSRIYGRISHKSDVYSYGILVLEMIGARNKERMDESASSNTSSVYFPEWIYKDIGEGYNKRLVKNGISTEEEKIERKMTLVGLWCIQSSPSNRPPMNRVVEMMEGDVNALEVPPKPVLQQIPTVPLPKSSTLIEDI
ncbi:LEAF RUST 10 DISEASE-RESISTANCE LOCUS RECEPTOR-LIKE PROTEIN KINASE-like 2.8 [Cardamine amara subsp. amara]|uniref:non-specific serine/threonine protein kinase n=1 Tax=Cardamine amara subsp. amara TaxID=228776 RepID=A0ABD0ZCK3_CARAN